MREIKFRAFDKQNNSMVQFDFNNIYGYEGEICGVILPDCQTALNFNSGFGNDGINESLIIMQYTGLKDKNGAEIYEDDIVKWTRRQYTDCSKNEIEEETVYLGTAQWNETMLALAHKEGSYLIMPYYIETDEFEVIGNIYENPELINKNETEMEK